MEDCILRVFGKLPRRKLSKARSVFISFLIISSGAYRVPTYLFQPQGRFLTYVSFAPFSAVHLFLGEKRTKKQKNTYLFLFKRVMWTYALQLKYNWFANVGMAQINCFVPSFILQWLCSEKLQGAKSVLIYVLTFQLKAFLRCKGWWLRVQILVPDCFTSSSISQDSVSQQWNGNIDNTCLSWLLWEFMMWCV